ncbi:TonB-dependent receptor [Sediminitomix flava]|uniref:Iron complex outermembrane receptor protein n=1 Tax=Sediminitomix flava TaxID=379075 RepID=A0A316A028_SEDFL|nr:TonB-dependent receptor [Sediminitomix flava]PWJ42997.1 iron complex outermembrane receptor protein [Sediminitomix flava]
MKLLELFWGVFVLICLCPPTFAQENPCTSTIKGKILDIETKEPIPYVTIKVRGTDKITITDIQGDFEIKGLCENQRTLIISCYGYCDSVCEDYNHKGQTPHIYLTQKVRQLDDVVIKAQKKEDQGIQTLSYQTIDKDLLERDFTQSIASAISNIDGVTLVSTGANVQLPVIHGLYGNRILILNNGLKHGFQNWGTDHAPEISLSSAEDITVLKGAAGVKYGPEALGGVLLIESAPLYFQEPFNLDATASYQTNGRGLFSSLDFGKGGDKWSYHLGGSYTKIGDRFAPDYSLTNSGKEEVAFHAGGRYQLKDWDFNLYYSFVDQDLALLRSSVFESGTAFINAINADEPLFIEPFSYEINAPNQTTIHHLGKIKIDWNYKESNKFTFLSGVQLNKRQEFDVRRNANKPIIDLDLLTTDYQLEWKHPNWGSLSGLVGLQLFTQNNDNNPGTDTTPFIPNYNSTRYSAFVIESLRKGKNTFEFGLRVDTESNNVRGRETNQDIFRDEYTFTNLTLSFGFIRELSDFATFRTNFGSAWRTPNMAELYSFGQHGFKATFGLLRYRVEDGVLKTDKVLELDDSDVSPENGLKWINEWRMEKESNTFVITAYSHYIQNFIFERPAGITGTVRGPLPVFIYDQVDALFIGGDFTWRKQWLQNLNGQYSISYLWSRNIEDNEVLINQPPLTNSYRLTWDTPRFWTFNESQLNLSASYTFEQFQAPRTIPPEDIINGDVELTPDSEIFDFKDAPSGYFLLDLSYRFKVGRFDNSFSIQNLLNNSYRNYLNEMRYFADEPGINFLFTVRYLL